MRNVCATTLSVRAVNFSTDTAPNTSSTDSHGAGTAEKQVSVKNDPLLGVLPEVAYSRMLLIVVVSEQE